MGEREGEIFIEKTKGAECPGGTSSTALLVVVVVLDNRHKAPGGDNLIDESDSGDEDGHTRSSDWTNTIEAFGGESEHRQPRRFNYHTHTH